MDKTDIEVKKDQIVKLFIQIVAQRERIYSSEGEESTTPLKASKELSKEILERVVQAYGWD